jgi:REP element-mobilizing transposase RayT
MRRSKISAYVHIVWATYQRMPLVVPEIEPALFRCIAQEATRLRCDVLAIGGMPDHVHAVVAFPATVTFSQFAKQVKGASSRLAKERLMPAESFFAWQEGYGLFTLSPNHVERAIAYVRNQKEHHAAGHVWAEWEETDEETP